MQRYFIYLSYDGTRYHGWQIQPNGISVQETLEKALECLLRRPCPIVGAGRTDTGVHARMMTAHFDCEEPLADCQDLAKRLNAFLPKDIAIGRICPVDAQMHARFSATRRTYEYHVCTVKDPFAEAYCLQVRPDTDFEAMNRAAALLTGFTDFTSFSKLHTDVKTNNCKIVEAIWRQVSPSHWVFTISAD
ncbi:MAG: tRNA pseudouridine synthase A, partial [Paludibacteraceae bacterium]|nr:tRNA pseudouridine synthase A [Paludibacteraceae bacterium]